MAMVIEEARGALDDGEKPRADATTAKVIRVRKAIFYLVIIINIYYFLEKVMEVMSFCFQNKKLMSLAVTSRLKLKISRG